MDIKKIETEPSSLQSDAKVVNQMVADIRKQMKDMFNAVDALDKMWDGPTSDAFKAQFINDYDTMEEICKNINELAQCITYAGGEYTRCEEAVKTAVKKIQI